MFKTILNIFVFLLILSGCGPQKQPHQTTPPLSTPRHSSAAIDSRFTLFLNETTSVMLNKRLRPHPESRGYALVIGINDYRAINDLGFCDLDEPRGEAERMEALLKISGYQVKLLTDAVATQKNIVDWLTFFAGLSGNNRLLIYFSGHGATFGSVKRFIAPHQRSALEAALGVHPGRGNNTQKDASLINKRFFIIPHQESDSNHTTTPAIRSLVGDHDIIRILSSSTAAEKILMIDACMAKEKNVFVFNPKPVYAYQLQRQGYLFLSMFKDVVLDGEFSPLIVQAMNGSADQGPAGNSDGIVSMFEMINFIDLKWKTKMGARGIVDNRIKYIIYGSGDIPLTVTNP